MMLNGAKDSFWLQLEVCREYQRSRCTRPDGECKFAHPPTNVEVQPNGRVTACYDSIKGRCQRDSCKYMHPPAHLKDQLLINGRNHLALKNAILQQHQQAAAVVGSFHHALPNSPSVSPLDSLISSAIASTLTKQQPTSPPSSCSSSSSVQNNNNNNNNQLKHQTQIQQLNHSSHHHQFQQSQQQAAMFQSALAIARHQQQFAAAVAAAAATTHASAHSHHNQHQPQQPTQQQQQQPPAPPPPVVLPPAASMLKSPYDLSHLSQTNPAAALAAAFAASSMNPFTAATMSHFGLHQANQRDQIQHHNGGGGGANNSQQQNYASQFAAAAVAAAAQLAAAQQQHHHQHHHNQHQTRQQHLAAGPVAASAPPTKRTPSAQQAPVLDSLTTCNGGAELINSGYGLKNGKLQHQSPNSSSGDSATATATTTTTTTTIQQVAETTTKAQKRAASEGCDSELDVGKRARRELEQNNNDTHDDCDKLDSELSNDNDQQQRRQLDSARPLTTETEVVDTKSPNSLSDGSDQDSGSSSNGGGGGGAIDNFNCQRAKPNKISNEQGAEAVGKPTATAQLLTSQATNDLANGTFGGQTSEATNWPLAFADTRAQLSYHQPYSSSQLPTSDTSNSLTTAHIGRGRQQNGGLLQAPMQKHLARVADQLNAVDSNQLDEPRLEVCREFLRNNCHRPEHECRFAHPLSHQITSTRPLRSEPGPKSGPLFVTVCKDFLHGNCLRANTYCRYLHPASHLQHQLLASRVSLATNGASSGQRRQRAPAHLTRRSTKATQ